MGKIILTICLLTIKFTWLPNLSVLFFAFGAVGVDFITGILKARILKQERTSEGYRKSVGKYVQYVFGVVGSALLGVFKEFKIPGFEYLSAGAVAIIVDAVLVFILVIEVKSIFENLYAINDKSPFSRYFIRPILSILSLGLEKASPPDITKTGGDVVKVIIAVVSLVGFTSCKGTRLIGTDIKDSTSVQYKPVQVKIAGASVGSSISPDSLLKAFNAALAASKGDTARAKATLGTYYRPVTVTDPQTKAELSYWIDEYGKLQISCTSKDQTIQMLIAELSRVRQETRQIEVTKPVWYTWVFLGWAVLGTLLLLIIFFAKR